MSRNFISRSGSLTLLAVLSLSFAVSACAKDDEPLGTPVEDNPCDIPLETASGLLSWLNDGGYEDWAAESAIHGSAGPHFGNVRTWVNPELEASLEADSESHPLCSASVKELYGGGESRRGWAVSVKVADTGDASDWYWFEDYDDELIAAGTDVDVCTDCHVAGPDYIRTPFPLD